jgi:uncharacterized membrane protein YphA (DoxX/SURF4 family)
MSKNAHFTMKSILVRIAQLFVGGLFIFSGLVKMNDPVGFSFKLEEYFSEEVLNLPIFEPLALPIAILLVAVEVLLGLALLMGIWKRFVLILLSAMIGFFTFLTFWSAYFNQVTDCGCFGDAIPLTPWESFYKDVVLSVLILILWWGINQIFDGVPKVVSTIVMSLGLVFSILFTYQVMNHLPSKDFRPYAEGLSIIEGMKPAEELGLEPPKFEVIYTMENDKGERQEISSSAYIDEKWWEKTEWTMLSELSKTIKVSDGYEPPVHDFSIMNDYGDLTDSILSLDEVWLLVAYNRVKTSENGWQNILPMVQQLEQNNTPYLILSASMPEEFTDCGYSTTMPFAFTDETTLKTMVRSNPGWVVLNKGTVIKKYHHNDSPK